MSALRRVEIRPHPKEEMMTQLIIKYNNKKSKGYQVKTSTSYLSHQIQIPIAFLQI